MLSGSRIAVIVPALDEERLIGRTLATVPAFVDAVYVIDDGSRDATPAIAREVGGARTTVVCHAENLGVGAAIRTGYRAARADGADVLVVMAGDAQMHPDDLYALLAPVVRGAAEYAKGDRLRHTERRKMPWLRRTAGAVLSTLTRWATGIDRLSDSQCGYTAMAASAIDRIDLDGMWPRYGYPNDLLGMIALAGLRVANVPVRPVYGDETSGLRPWHVVVMLGLIVRVATRRARQAVTRRGRALAGRASVVAR